MRTARRATMVLAATVSMVGMASPASADNLHSHCYASGPFGSSYSLNIDGYYYTSGANHVWTNFDYILQGHQTGGKSNVNAALWNGTSNYYWGHVSPDNRQHATQYSIPMNVAVPASAAENFRFEGIFDIAGSDPSCFEVSASV